MTHHNIEFVIIKDKEKVLKLSGRSYNYNEEIPQVTIFKTKGDTIGMQIPPYEERLSIIIEDMMRKYNHYMCGRPKRCELKIKTIEVKD